MALTSHLHKALSFAPGAVGDKARFVDVKKVLDAGGAVGHTSISKLAGQLLDRADTAHDKGDRDNAIEWAYKAFTLLFHKTVHYGPGLSPVKDRDLSFFSPIRSSVVGKLLTESSDKEVAPRTGGTKILVLATSSWTFIERVRDAMEPMGFEFRFRDVSPEIKAHGVSRRSLLEMRYDLSTRGTMQQVPAEWAEDLAWADTVVLEWASMHAAWVSFMEGMAPKVVTRLHSYEAFTQFPLITNWANTDSLVFVSPHVRTLCEALAPRIGQANVETILNIHDFTGYVADKEPGYEKTLFMAGWNKPVKDVLFAFDVLELLLEADPSWKLLLAGSDINRSQPTPFEAEVARRLQALGNHVQLLGFRHDMPNVYKKAGFLLSTSRHEGFHETINEGAASATLPVVRDWPEYAAWGGAAGLYPDEWIVDSAQHAAELISDVVETGVVDEKRFKASHGQKTVRDNDEIVNQLRHSFA